MNPVKLKKKGKAWITCLFILILSFIFAFIAAAATPGINSSCSNYKIFIIIEPIWLFIYYRLYSRALIKAMDALTCTCAEHGIGYAVFHYAIWSMYVHCQKQIRIQTTAHSYVIIIGTVGHPYLCFSPFIYLNLAEPINILSDGSCTSNTSMTDSAIATWNVCFIIFSLLSLILIIPSGIVISFKNHKDVKFQLHWKEQDEKEKNEAIANAIELETTFHPIELNHNEHKDGIIHDDETHKAIAIHNVSSNTTEELNVNTTTNQTEDNATVDNNNQEANATVVPPVLMSADSEEQLRAAIAASMITAQNEEQTRNNGGDQQTTVNDNDDVPRELHRQKSESLSGFWAKGQAISTAYLTNLFSEKQYECVVCYEDYEVGQTLAKLKCGHQMHKKCAMDWLKMNPTCPFCRVNILRD